MKLYAQVFLKRIYQNTYFFWSDWWKYSVLPIYRGRVYRGIGYIAVTCWTPFLGAQECVIFREIAVTPWTQFAWDNFTRNLLTAITFVLGPRETIFRETNTSLPVNVGWNTYCAVVSHARRSIDTSIVSQSRVQLIQCQCKSRLQIANLGINNAFFYQILAVWPRCLHPPSCPDTGTVPQRIKSVWLVDIRRFL